ncbi:hypothetical protein P152DRAFT_485363 [Eremomyces bilateralis CBS 781.70]|uniref:RNase H type-1 domain-containing protein n=1 Tax=Eremomyces bilateralis CBS 781.70 TaxID=1392243 RepID=A0A6G1FS44_9PEZI|nr:uncharacterized protein P152DRAFT_485363 [Eremomyces bilateralis CBS 781.70]KAF1808556.1 hypothetical protein P152DRAFT_485363 [Eremomyces bilateralis CBS 781.70]
MDRAAEQRARAVEQMEWPVEQRGGAVEQMDWAVEQRARAAEQRAGAVERIGPAELRLGEERRREQKRAKRARRAAQRAEKATKHRANSQGGGAFGAVGGMVDASGALAFYPLMAGAPESPMASNPFMPHPPASFAAPGTQMVPQTPPMQFHGPYLQGSGIPVAAAPVQYCPAAPEPKPTRNGPQYGSTPVDSKWVSEPKFTRSGTQYGSLVGQFVPEPGPRPLQNFIQSGQVPSQPTSRNSTGNSMALQLPSLPMPPGTQHGQLAQQGSHSTTVRSKGPPVLRVVVSQGPSGLPTKPTSPTLLGHDHLPRLSLPARPVSKDERKSMVSRLREYHAAESESGYSPVFHGQVFIQDMVQAFRYALRAEEISLATPGAGKPELVFWTDASAANPCCRHAGVGLTSQCNVIGIECIENALAVTGLPSVSFAELFAVACALEAAAEHIQKWMKARDLVARNDLPEVTVFTDSQDVLRMCMMPDPRHRTEPTMLKLAAHSTWLHRTGVSMQLHWVPGHAGIKGNERADSLAGQARSYAQFIAKRNNLSSAQIKARGLFQYELPPGFDVSHWNPRQSIQSEAAGATTSKGKERAVTANNSLAGSIVQLRRSKLHDNCPKAATDGHSVSKPDWAGEVVDLTEDSDPEYLRDDSMPRIIGQSADSTAPVHPTNQMANAMDGQGGSVATAPRGNDLLSSDPQEAINSLLDGIHNPPSRHRQQFMVPVSSDTHMEDGEICESPRIHAPHRQASSQQGPIFKADDFARETATTLSTTNTSMPPMTTGSSTRTGTDCDTPHSEVDWDALISALDNSTAASTASSHDDAGTGASDQAPSGRRFVTPAHRGNRGHRELRKGRWNKERNRLYREESLGMEEGWRSSIEDGVALRMGPD